MRVGRPVLLVSGVGAGGQGAMFPNIGGFDLAVRFVSSHCYSMYIARYIDEPTYDFSGVRVIPSVLTCY